MIKVGNSKSTEQVQQQQSEDPNQEINDFYANVNELQSQGGGDILTTATDLYEEAQGFDDPNVAMNAKNLLFNVVRNSVQNGDIQTQEAMPILEDMASGDQNMQDQLNLLQLNTGQTDEQHQQQPSSGYGQKKQPHLTGGEQPQVREQQQGQPIQKTEEIQETRNSGGGNLQVFLDEVNAVRAKNGKPPLELDMELSAEQQEKIQKTGFNHEKDGVKPTHAEILFQTSGTPSNDKLAKASVDPNGQSWVTSGSHFQTMTDPKYTKIGFGVTQDGNGNTILGAYLA
jgi:uncharacterized protein YkwD